jgi:hypothetical protein
MGRNGIRRLVRTTSPEGPASRSSSLVVPGPPFSREVAVESEAGRAHCYGQPGFRSRWSCGRVTRWNPDTVSGSFASEDISIVITLLTNAVEASSTSAQSIPWSASLLEMQGSDTTMGSTTAPGSGLPTFHFLRSWLVIIMNLLDWSADAAQRLSVPVRVPEPYPTGS